MRIVCRTGIAALFAMATLGLGHWSATAEPQTVTKSLQGAPNSAWKNDRHLHALYDMTIAAFAKGADNVDLPAYQAVFYAIIRAKAVVAGAKPEAMVDHIKDIPTQMIGIVKNDPKVLDSLDNFAAALVGPS